jgi:centrosomal protein CEP290
MMHGRELQGSDEDSPDQLSEIDRQQELMAKISAKNKHIRRLLRDIEVNSN